MLIVFVTLIIALVSMLLLYSTFFFKAIVQYWWPGGSCTKCGSNGVWGRLRSLAIEGVLLTVGLCFRDLQGRQWWKWKSLAGRQVEEDLMSSNMRRLQVFAGNLDRWQMIYSRFNSRISQAFFVTLNELDCFPTGAARSLASRTSVSSSSNCPLGNSLLVPSAHSNQLDLSASCLRLNINSGICFHPTITSPDITPMFNFAHGKWRHPIMSFKNDFAMI